MKNLKENVNKFKAYMLKEEAKHKELKLLARMSSNNPNYSVDKVSDAQYKVTYSSTDMFVIYIAYYIVKHNLYKDGNKEEQYLKQVAEQTKKWYNWCGTPDYNYFLTGYFHDRIIKLVNEYKDDVTIKQSNE